MSEERSELTLNKPPLGVSPHWFVLPKRMAELHDAIGRWLDYLTTHQTTEYAAQGYECVAQWAEELKSLAMLEARLIRRGNENAE